MHHNRVQGWGRERPVVKSFQELFERGTVKHIFEKVTQLVKWSTEALPLISDPDFLQQLA